MTDHELLTAYQRQRLPALLSALIARHIDLVYSIARRNTRDPHLADDLTQEVFLCFAQKAGRLRPDTLLPAWLFTTTRLVCLQHHRAQRRRSHHESEAAMSQQTPPSPDPTWPLIAQEIDAAVAELSTTDRNAILLRYFAGQSMAEVAKGLTISEEAAKKRVQRALESLHHLLASRGLATTGALSLAAALSTQAVHAAPSALASSITTAAGTAATLTTKGTLMAVQFKIAASVAVTAIVLTTVAVSAVRLSRPVASSGALPATTPIDAASQPVDDAPATAAANWKGWGVGAYPAVSPFQAVRWKKDTPEVKVNGTWYQLLSVNDLPADKIVAFARSVDREWHRRFEEDFVALLAYMGHEPGETVTLQVKTLDTQKTETLADIPLTEKNRNAIRDARRADAPLPP